MQTKTVSIAAAGGPTTLLTPTSGKRLIVFGVRASASTATIVMNISRGTAAATTKYADETTVGGFQIDFTGLPRGYERLAVDETLVATGNSATVITLVTVWYDEID